MQLCIESLDILSITFRWFKEMFCYLGSRYQNRVKHVGAFRVCSYSVCRGHSLRGNCVNCRVDLYVQRQHGHYFMVLVSVTTQLTWVYIMCAEQVLYVTNSDCKNITMCDFIVIADVNIYTLQNDNWRWKFVEILTICVSVYHCTIVLLPLPWCVVINTSGVSYSIN